MAYARGDAQREFPGLHIAHYPEPDVSGSALRSVRSPRGIAIPKTKGRVAKVRSTLHDPRRSGWRTHRIRPRSGPVPARIEVIRAPLPDVSDDRVQLVAVRTESIHW